MIMERDEMKDNRSGNEHGLWISFSSRENSKRTGQLPKMMEEIMERLKEPQESEDEMDITFPSDYEWRTKLYFKLLDKQKEGKMEDDTLQESSKVLHDWNIIPSKSKKVPFCAPDAARLAKKEFLIGPGPITWTVSDISKAGCLLTTPPIPTSFSDEQEMRRVYTLIYDVYRYKSILSKALEDVAFFYEHPKMKKSMSRVWLLLYDLYHRSFKKRTVRNASVAQALFAESGLQEVEEAVWSDRVKLAASVARLRIKHSALRLSQLLPYHLRDEKVSTHAKHAPVTCWVNIKKVKNYDDLKAAIQKTLDLKLIEYHESLEMDSYKLDEHCPQFIIFHPSIRTKLAQSTLVQKHKLIVQDKSFCVGPATFGKIISDLQLSGTVIQSHVNSPRTTAYLASLLSQNENIKKLLAFSAGNRKSEYENYFNDLGIKNILIFSEKLIDLPPDSTSLEEVIAVFATPPNSYSAVADPIDLVCSRGGDLSMLEVLTETEDTLEGKRRVATILEEQKNTLKFAMSRPQIQFVLYETHSEIEAENNQMVRRTVSEINKCAKIHHATIQGKLKYLEPSDSESEVKVIESKNFDDTEDSEGTTPVTSEPEIVPKIKKKEQIIVPDCDLFDVSNLPQLCPNSGTCTKVNKEGCYLALMQRKQVTRLDNKYMIQMAETRGLFGSEMGKKSSKNMKKKVERTTPSPPLKIRRVKEIEIGRIAAPTLSSVGHSKFVNVGSSNECMKHKHQQKTPQTRRWWTETTRHITNVRHSLSKQKILPSVNNTEETTKGHATKFVNSLVRQTKKVDEIVAKSSKNSSSVPFYPKLRLTRNTNRYDNKIPVPIHVTLVTFPAKHFPIS